MSNLSQIKADSNWGDASNTINTNFQNMDVELEKLKNSTTKFKGYFTSESNLYNKFPSPKRGDIAFVGEPYPGNVYDVLTDGSWHNTTKAPETGSVDLQDYVTKDDFEASQKEQDDKFTELSDNVGLYNVDKHVPLGGGFYTSATARAAVPSDVRKIGLIITYKTDVTTSVTEQFIGSDVSGWTTDTNWKNVGSEGGNKILEWKTDAATTRKKVPAKERKAGMQISYKPTDSDWVNEQYVGTSFTDTEWVKDSNWEKIPKQKQLTELEKGKANINNNYSESKMLDKSDGFYFTDKNGNVISKILSDGIHAVALYDKDGNKIGSADASIKSIKDKIKQDGFYFTDAVGNIIAKITKDGLQAIKFLDKDGNELGSSGNNKSHPLFGKDIYSFGNSLCTGAWEQMLADITGANFSKEANKLTSWGGTFTGDEGGPLYNEDGYGKNGDMPGGLRRAKNFVLMPKETYGNKDVIFFENVHDAVSESEDISKFMPFMWTRYAIYEGQEFYDTNAAGRYFEENRSSVLQSVGFTTPQVGTMVRMKVKVVTLPLAFSNGATTSGSVKITINGNDFETEVAAGDTIEQVIDKISVWSFSDSTGWKNKKLNSTTINLQYVGGNSSSEDDVITFDGKNTGVIAIVKSKTESISYRTHAFFSLDVKEWNNPEAWSYYAHHARCYAQWKGVIEYIQKNCPETKMYMLLIPNSAYKKSYIRPDGSFDVEAFYSSTAWQQHVNNRRCLINIADYYNIPIIDLEKEMNVMCNWETYYPENNVHMKSTLYQRFAEIIASKVY